MGSRDYLETQDLCLDEPAMSASFFGERDNQIEGPSSGLTRRRKKTGIAEGSKGRSSFLMLKLSRLIVCLSITCLRRVHKYSAAQLHKYNAWHAE